MECLQLVEDHQQYTITHHAMTDLNINEADAIVKTLLLASGYCYHSGTKSVTEFIEMFHFHPANYHKFFRISKYNRVSVTDEYREWCKVQFQMTRNNYARLEITVR